MNTGEAQFIAAADAFGFEVRDQQPLLQRMRDWQAGLAEALGALHLDCAGLLPDSGLAQQARAINGLLVDAQRNGDAAWAALAPARSLADAFDDRVMLLVFGKFNAGKSSLCNLLAARFAAHGRPVRYFHLEAGRVVETAQALHEGPTETTAGLQGVCLGNKLVLLDTPGLLSVTSDNAALTQRVVESADALLWLTGSTSPGQVQELDELARELHRGKPLLPVITRSDCVEEDEVDGAIVACLRNKSAANRNLQEADVEQRARDKLASLGVDLALLRRPVSISAHMAGRGGSVAAEMADAGFERLYGALAAMAAPALAYKQRKAAEVLLHHLDENLHGCLKGQVVPALVALGLALQAEGEALVQRQARIVEAAWRAVVPELPELLERPAEGQGVSAMCETVSRRVAVAFDQQARERLAAFALPAAAPSAMALDRDLADEAVSAEAEPRGNVAVPGYERLHAALESAVLRRLTEQAAQAVRFCGETLARLQNDVRRLQDEMLARGQQLARIRGECRALSGPAGN